jgi:hypothetical protein
VLAFFCAFMLTVKQFKIHVVEIITQRSYVVYDVKYKETRIPSYHNRFLYENQGLGTLTHGDIPGISEAGFVELVVTSLKRGGAGNLVIGTNATTQRNASPTSIPRFLFCSPPPFQSHLFPLSDMLLPPQHISEPDRCFFIKVQAASGSWRQNIKNSVISQEIRFSFKDQVDEGVRFSVFGKMITS